MINIDKLNKRIEILKSDKPLLLKHGSYGVFRIKMNPQRNRIFIDKIYEAQKYFKEIPKVYQEIVINDCLFWDRGLWYTMDKKKQEQHEEPDIFTAIKQTYNLEGV